MQTPGTPTAQPDAAVQAPTPGGTNPPAAQAQTPPNQTTQPATAHTPAQRPQGQPDGPRGPQVSPSAEAQNNDDQKAVVDRLKQMNARQGRLLQSLGIEATSDLAEQLELGMITEDQLRAHIAGRTTAPAQAAQTPAAGQTTPDLISQAQQELQEAKQACEEEGASQGGVTFQTLDRYNKAVLQLQEARQNVWDQERRLEQTQRQYNEISNQILTTAQSGEYYQYLQDDSDRQLADQVHLALTGTLMNQAAQQHGLDPMRMTPQQVGYFARQASQQLGRIIQRISQGIHGSALPQPAPGPTHPVNVPLNQTFNPQSFVPAPGGGGVPQVPQNPFGNVTVKSHRDAARAYATQAQMTP